MNLLNLVKLLRESFLDDVGGSGVSWEDIKEDDLDAIQLRWSNEELTSHINEAVKQVYRRILPVQVYEPEFDINVEATVHSYDLDSRIIRIVGAKLATLDKQLFRIDHQDLWFSDTKWDTRTGNPEGYLQDYGTNIIRLYPIPVAVDTLQLFVNRFPLEDLSWDCNTTVVELREEFQYPMLYWAAHLAYKKDEANTYDPNKAAQYEADFNKEFPVTSAYSDTRKRRTNNRGVRYGGIDMLSGPYGHTRRFNPYGWNQ